MAITIVTVPVTTTPTSLGTLISTAQGTTWQNQGVTQTAPGPRVSQITLQNDPASAGPVYVGNRGMTAAANRVAIAAGSQQVYGTGENPIGDTGLLYLATATGTATLNVVLVD